MGRKPSKITLIHEEPTKTVKSSLPESWLRRRSLSIQTQSIRAFVYLFFSEPNALIVRKPNAQAFVLREPPPLHFLPPTSAPREFPYQHKPHCRVIHRIWLVKLQNKID